MISASRALLSAATDRGSTDCGATGERAPNFDRFRRSVKSKAIVRMVLFLPAMAMWVLMMVAIVGQPAAARHKSIAQVVTIQAPRAFILLEVAKTNRARTHGLMFRRRLAPHTGMIFVFPDEDQRNFWMENTLIPLDMVFVNAGGNVTSVAANVPAMRPQDTAATVARRSGEGRFVLELPAGEASSDGLQPGSHLDLSALSI